MSHRREAVGRFVETDVAVVSQTQKLQVDAAYVSDNLVVCVTGFVCVRLCSIWHECTLFRKIYVVEEVVVHKIAVALVIVARQTFVLVQVYAGCFGEIQITVVIACDQLFISADG